MSEFLKLTRVDTYVGVSPTALRSMMRVLEDELAKFQREQEQGQKGAEETRQTARCSQSFGYRFSEKTSF